MDNDCLQVRVGFIDGLTHEQVGQGSIFGKLEGHCVRQQRAARVAEFRGVVLGARVSLDDFFVTLLRQIRPLESHRTPVSALEVRGLASFHLEALALNRVVEQELLGALHDSRGVVNAVVVDVHLHVFGTGVNFDVEVLLVLLRSPLLRPDVHQPVLAQVYLLERFGAKLHNDIALLSWQRGLGVHDALGYFVGVGDFGLEVDDAVGHCEHLSLARDVPLEVALRDLALADEAEPQVLDCLRELDVERVHHPGAFLVEVEEQIGVASELRVYLPPPHLGKVLLFLRFEPSARHVS